MEDRDFLEDLPKYGCILIGIAFGVKIGYDLDSNWYMLFGAIVGYYTGKGVGFLITECSLKGFLLITPLLACCGCGIYLGYSIAGGEETINLTKIICSVIGLFIGMKVGLIITEIMEGIIESSQPKEQRKQSYSSNTNQNSNSKAAEIDVYKWAYEILQSKPSDDNNTIKQNYRNLAKQLHPDSLGSNASETMQRIAKEEYQKLNNAYELIKKTRGMK